MSPAPRARYDPRTILIEVSFLVGVFLYYVIGNQFFEVQVDPTRAFPSTASAAHENAVLLWQFESWIGLDWEVPFYEFTLANDWLFWLFMVLYVFMHFALSLGFLLWVYFFRFESFAYVRNAALIVTVTAFTYEWIFPVAPPRLVTDFGMIDLVKERLPVNNTTPWINTLVNDYAGFPSVHTSWSLVVAVMAIRFARSPWRWLWLVYPTMVGASIVGTANHVTWDVWGAFAWVAACELFHNHLAERGVLPRFDGDPGPRPAPVAVGA